MDGQTDRQIPLCSTGLGPPQGHCPAPPQLKSHTPLKQSTGTAGHLLPLGCYLGLYHAQGHIFLMFLLFYTLLRLHS